jgi:hypothetical protein
MPSLDCHSTVLYADCVLFVSTSIPAWDIIVFIIAIPIQSQSQSQGVPVGSSYGGATANAVYGASAYTMTQTQGQGQAPSSSAHYNSGGEMAVDGIGDDGEQGGGGYDSPRGRQLGTQQRLR